MAPAERLSVPEPLAGAVAIWAASLAVDENARRELHSVLTAEERARAAHYSDARRGERFAVGRGIVRRLLAETTGVAPDALSFVYGPDGKPALQRVNGLPVPHFNVSHARDLMVLAVSWRYELGVDVSFVNGRLPVERVAQRFFSAAERRSLADQAGDEAKRARFTRIWVRKEAWLKGIGRGISQRIYETDFGADERGDGTVEAPVAGREGWWLADLGALPPGVMASVAVRCGVGTTLSSSKTGVSPAVGIGLESARPHGAAAPLCVSSR